MDGGLETWLRWGRKNIDMSYEIKVFDLHELVSQLRIFELRPRGVVRTWVNDKMIDYKYNVEKGVWEKQKEV